MCFSWPFGVFIVLKLPRQVVLDYETNHPKGSFRLMDGKQFAKTAAARKTKWWLFQLQPLWYGPNERSFFRLYRIILYLSVTEPSTCVTQLPAWCHTQAFGSTLLLLHIGYPSVHVANMPVAAETNPTWPPWTATCTDLAWTELKYQCSRMNYNEAQWCVFCYSFVKKGSYLPCTITTNTVWLGWWKVFTLSLDSPIVAAVPL